MALSAVEQQIAAVAQRLGVDPRLAIATAQVESGLNPGAVGDQGTSFGLFQLHQGGELGSLTPSQAFDPTTNASVALRQFAAVEAAHPGVTDPGTIAALAQRPANPAAYAAAVDKAYGGLGAVSDALTRFGTQCVQFVEALFAPLPGFHTPASPGSGLVGTAAQYAGSGPGSLGSMGWGELAPSTAALGVEPGDIIVGQPGSAIAGGPAGHVVAVSGLEQGGGVQIVQSNAPEGSGPTVSTLTAAELGGPGISVWHPPAAEQASAAALAQGAAAQLGGGAPGGPQQATLADYQLASATSGPGFSWWDPRAWIDAVAGTAGNVAGTAAGAAAGAAAGGIVTGVAAASEGFFGSAVRPWFDKNVVPLAVGVVIVLIVFGGPERIVNSVQITRSPAEEEGGEEEQAPAEPAGGGSSYFREVAGAGEKAAPVAAAAAV